MIDSASNLRIPSSPRGVIQRRGSSSRDNLSGRDYFSGRGDFSGTGGFSSRGGLSSRGRRDFSDREGSGYASRGGNISSGSRVSNQRRPGNVQENKSKIIIVGSSHARDLDKVVRLNEEGSYRVAMSGAGIEEIMKEAEEATKKVEGDCSIFLIGGGNSVMKMVPEEIVKVTIEGVKKMKGVNQTKICVLSILARPKEGREYERQRRYINRRLKEEIMKIRKEYENRDEDAPVSFLDLEWVIKLDMFSRDGVHLNFFGTQKVGREIISIVRFNDRRKVSNRD